MKGFFIFMYIFFQKIIRRFFKNFFSSFPPPHFIIITGEKKVLKVRKRIGFFLKKNINSFVDIIWETFFLFLMVGVLNMIT